MYLLDKILYVLLYIVTRAIKILFFVAIITIIVGFVISTVLAASLGPIAIFPGFLAVIATLGTLGYVVFYIIHDVIEVITLRLDPLHPKTLFEDIAEHTPVFNAIYKGIQVNNNPFKNMKNYSY